MQPHPSTVHVQLTEVWTRYSDHRLGGMATSDFFNEPLREVPAAVKRFYIQISWTIRNQSIISIGLSKYCGRGAWLGCTELWRCRWWWWRICKVNERVQPAGDTKTNLFTSINYYIMLDGWLLGWAKLISDRIMQQSRNPCQWLYCGMSLPVNPPNGYGSVMKSFP